MAWPEETCTNDGASADATGDQPLSFDIELLLTADATGRNASTSNSIVLTGAGTGTGTICSGEVQQLGQSGFIATCQGSGPLSGQQLQLVGAFDGGLANQVSGSLRAGPAG